ncbi:MAG TPA: aldehyde dehydrogenase family protein [Actinoplanes sp.]|nr:aldehyde dehydrogenase family protein [Actinoplanes sp.]
MLPRLLPPSYERPGTMPIAGHWRVGRADRTLTDCDPWSGEVLVRIREADVTDVDDACATADIARHRWGQSVPERRAAVMRAAADLVTARHDELAQWLIHETGATTAKVAIELGVVRAAFLAAAALPYQAESRILPSDVPGAETRVYRRPAGVVCLIGAWDLPLYLTTRTLAAALALGNAVVLKPSSHTPVSGGLLPARLLEEAGLPDGVLNVVVGQAAEIGDALVSHPIPQVVAFTGSAEAGLRIAREAGLKRLLLEVGGNAPLVVLDDADLAYAVESALFGAFFPNGQIRTIANRVIVDATRHDEFVDRIVDRARRLVIGDPSDPVTDIGPMISRRHLEAVRDKVKRSAAQGAEVLLGGDPIGPTGLALPPQVLLGTNDVVTAQEEIFGPVLTIIRAHDEHEAALLANDTAHGPCNAVHTRDSQRGARFALRLNAGTTHVNGGPPHDESPSVLNALDCAAVIDRFTVDHRVVTQR